MKGNVLIIDRMGFSHYYKNGDPIIDYSKYNVFIMTSKIWNIKSRIMLT